VIQIPETLHSIKKGLQL